MNQQILQESEGEAAREGSVPHYLCSIDYQLSLL